MNSARGRAGGANLAEHAAPASPSRGVSARSLAPNRLFAASVHDIKREKERYSPKKFDEGSTDACDEEVSDTLEPSSGSPTLPQPFDHLQVREEPSGAETDDCEDLVDAASAGKEEGYGETIRVQITTETIIAQESLELSPVSSAPVNSEEDLPPDNCGVAVEVEEVKCPVKRPKKRSKHRTEEVEASSSERHSSSSRKRRSSDLKTNKYRKQERSKSPKRHHKRRHQSSPDYDRASSSTAGSKSRERHSNSYRKKHNSSSDDARVSRVSRSLHKDDLSLPKSDSRASGDKDFAHKSSKASYLSTNRRDADSLRHLSKSDMSVQMEPTPGIEHNLIEIAPLAKMSSSETFVSTAISSESEEDIVDHRISTVRDGGMSNSNLSVSQSKTGLTKASTAPDYIPLSRPYQQNESSSSDAHYIMPALQNTNTPYRSPLLSYYIPLSYSDSFFYPDVSGTPPQPAAPSMHSGGRFQWETPSTTGPSSPLMGAPHATTHQPPPIPPPPAESDRRFQCLQNLHDPPKPSFHGYQLIGDSMLLRFSQQLLGENAILAESLRFLGYCVSGQRVGELLRRLRSGFYHLGKKVVLMIGTNDLLKNTNLNQMQAELRRVVEFLRSSVEELIVLTLPPVPRLENMTYHWKRLNGYNDYIKQLANKDSGISVYDISPKYVLTQEELEEAELLAEFNAQSPFCPGCLTCMEDGVDWDYSGQSDEDDIGDTAMLTRVFISTSPPVITPVDICTLFVDKRIKRCRMDCFETCFSDSSRKDMIHLNKKGLTFVRQELYKAI